MHGGSHVPGEKFKLVALEGSQVAAVAVGIHWRATIIGQTPGKDATESRGSLAAKPQAEISGTSG